MQGKTRNSWESTSLGSIASLRKVASPVPEPAADEVVVGVRAIGLNFADIFCCLGLYEAANAVLKERADAGEAGAFCPGLEFSGEVLALGSAVTQSLDGQPLRVGDRVFGFTRFGAYRSVVVTRAIFVRPIPKGWSFAEATSLLAQGLTAWHGLVPLGATRKGSRVLVHSAAGGVGAAAMQICTSTGCEVVGVVGSESKVEFLQQRFPKATVLVRGPEKGYAAHS
jgi:alcohol dehydrogenase